MADSKLVGRRASSAANGVGEATSNPSFYHANPIRSADYGDQLLFRLARGEPGPLYPPDMSALDKQRAGTSTTRKNKV